MRTRFSAVRAAAASATLLQLLAHATAAAPPRGGPPWEVIRTASPRLALGAPGWESATPIVSSNGQFIVFTSLAPDLVTNLVPPELPQAYIRNLADGSIRLVSVALDGMNSGNKASFASSVSDDGRFVVFESRASNLVTNETWGRNQIFVRDTAASRTSLVTIDTQGKNGASEDTCPESISSDASVILFSSTATNLTPADQSNANHVYLRDVATQTTQLVSRNRTTKALARETFATPHRAILAQTSQIGAFEWRNGTALISPDLSSKADICVWNRTDDRIVFGSKDTSGKQCGTDAYAPSLSHDGLVLAFITAATEFGEPPLTVARPCLYRRDLGVGFTDRITPATITTNGIESNYAMSAAGDRFAFVVDHKLHLWDITSKTSRVVSTNSTGTPVTGAFDALQFSDDGTKLVFTSSAPGLVANPQVNVNGWRVYALDVPTGRIDLLSTPLGPNEPQPEDCQSPFLSQDGTTVAFIARNAASDGALHVLARRLAEPWSTIVSAPMRPKQAPRPFPSLTFPLGLSADGSRMLFASTDASLATNKSTAHCDLFLHDFVANTTRLITSSASKDRSGDSGTAHGVISANGRYVAFVSPATNLVANSTNVTEDFYWTDLDSGTTVLIPRPGAVGTSNCDRLRLAISSDGLSVFTGYTSTSFIYLWKAVENTVTPLPQTGIGFQTSISLRDAIIGESIQGELIRWKGTNLYALNLTKQLNRLLTPAQYGATLSADRRYLFAANRGIPSYAFTRFDLSRNIQVTTNLPNVGVSSLYSKLHRISPSADGKSAALALLTTNVDGGTALPTSQIAVADFPDSTSPPTITMISLNTNGHPASGDSWAPSTSADGRFIAFASTAPDIVQGDTNNKEDVFLFDRNTGEITLLSTGLEGHPASGTATVPLWSDALNAVIYASDAPNAIPDDGWRLNTRLLANRTPGFDLEDQDDDGLPDVWELHFFGDLSHTPEADDDHDGFDNLTELRLGTNPALASNATRIAILGTTQPGTLSLGWFGPRNARFQLEVSTSLDVPDWRPSDVPIFLNSEPGSFTWTALVSATSDSTSLFVRLKRLE